MNLPNLELIQERFYNIIKDAPEFEECKYYLEFEVDVFAQIWGDTSLGFGGIGGQTITGAYTTVITELETGMAGVFFGNRFAYLIKNPNEEFYKDLEGRDMEGFSTCGKYRRKD